jgi:hypothetical protein
LKGDEPDALNTLTAAIISDDADDGAGDDEEPPSASFMTSQVIDGFAAQFSKRAATKIRPGTTAMVFDLSFGRVYSCYNTKLRCCFDLFSNQVISIFNI